MSLSLDRHNFEAAIQAALTAPAISGSKWRLLEQLYAHDGIRVSGAILSTVGNRRSRVRQILARRRHAGFGTFGMPGYGILVLTGEEAELDQSDAEHLDRCIHAALLAEIAAAPERTKLAGVLILRHDGTQMRLLPRRLVQFTSSPVSEGLRDWYSGIDVACFARAAG